MPPSSSSSTSSSASLLLHSLPDPLLELALSLLPLPSLISASASNTHLRRLIASSAATSALFRHHPTHRSPWFLFFGQNLLLPSKSQSFAFDPISAAWFRIPFSSPPPHNQSSLSTSATSSLLFALSGALQKRLCICRWPKSEWEAIAEPMAAARAAPPLAVAEIAPLVVVAGGGDSEEGAEIGVVEIFDRSKREWRKAESLPEVLQSSSSSSSSSVICNGRLYIADCYSGAVARMDPAEGKWESTVIQRSRSAIWWSLVSVDGVRLLALLLCSGGDAGGAAIKLMEIDQTSLQLIGELATMPPDILPLLLPSFDICSAADSGGADGGGDGISFENKHVPLRCTGGGPGIIYIYSPTPFSNYPLVLCKISPTPASAGVSWFVAPPIPPPVNRFDRVHCFSAAMPLESFIKPPREG